jgi:hypothetical protein
VCSELRPQGSDDARVNGAGLSELQQLNQRIDAETQSLFGNYDAQPISRSRRGPNMGGPFPPMDTKIRAKLLNSEIKIGPMSQMSIDVARLEACNYWLTTPSQRRLIDHRDEKENIFMWTLPFVNFPSPTPSSSPPVIDVGATPPIPPPPPIETPRPTLLTPSQANEILAMNPSDTIWQLMGYQQADPSTQVTVAEIAATTKAVTLSVEDQHQCDEWTNASRMIKGTTLRNDITSEEYIGPLTIPSLLIPSVSTIITASIKDEYHLPKSTIPLCSWSRLLMHAISYEMASRTNNPVSLLIKVIVPMDAFILSIPPHLMLECMSMAQFVNLMTICVSKSLLLMPILPSPFRPFTNFHHLFHCMVMV